MANKNQEKRPLDGLQGEQYNASILTKIEFAEAFAENPAPIQVELRNRYSLSNKATGADLYEAIRVTILRERGADIGS